MKVTIAFDEGSVVLYEDLLGTVVVAIDLERGRSLDREQREARFFIRDRSRGMAEEAEVCGILQRRKLVIPVLGK